MSQENQNEPEPGTKNTDDQSPSWRAFEKLVTRIEAALVPTGAEVKSPDRLRDRTTNELREVDASIRYTVGTTSILIILECRDRHRVQDSLWIEQLASKQASVGAAKCVAVSSSGFNQAAIKKAQALGIEIRHLRRIDDSDILKWAPKRTWFYQYHLTNVDPSYGINGVEKLDADLDKKINAELSKKHFLEDKILHRKRDGSLTSIRSYIEELINRFYGEASEAEKRKITTNKEYILSFCGEPEFWVECLGGKYDVIGIAFAVSFPQFHDYALERRAMFDYHNAKAALIRGMEFEAIDQRSSLRQNLSVHTDLATKKSKVSIWHEEPKGSQPRQEQKPAS